MSDSTSQQDVIERDLERTRSRMDNRLSELQERLSPGQIVDDLLGYFRGSEGGDFARNLMDSVRDNPLPAALTGIGLTWLMASNPKPRPAVGEKGVASSSTDSRTWTSQEELDLHFRELEQGVSRQADEDDTAYRFRVDEARGKALGVARQSDDTADSFSERVQQAFTAASQSVIKGAKDLRDSATDTASRLGGSAQSAMQSVGEKLTQSSESARLMSGNLLSTIGDNPVLLGALGLAVGALLGALVPQSGQEEAALGEVADKTRTAARTLAQGAMDRGGEVAQQALEAGRDSARTLGLTGDKTVGNVIDEALSGDLTGSIKQTAQDVMKAADEALHKSGANQTESPKAETSDGSTHVAAQPDRPSGSSA
jgi:hypothetical protein